MKVDRLVSIIMILLEKKKVSAEELANTFEVSKRTIYRDIDSICMAGIPIRATSGVGGGFEIMPGFKLDKNVFTEDDLSTLLMGLSGLSSVVRGDEIIHTISKVRSFIPPAQADVIASKTSQICIDVNSWITNPLVQAHLEKIELALKERHLLSFSYIDHKGNAVSRTVEPYQLVSKNSSWYFYGFCHLRNDYRLFKLSRMIDLEVCAESYVPKDFPAPILSADEISDSLKIYIKLRVHKSLLERMLDLCSFDQFTPDGDCYYIVKFPFIDRDYYYDMLLSFGDKCECLEPANVREKLSRKISCLAELYKDQDSIGEIAKMVEEISNCEEMRGIGQTGDMNAPLIPGKSDIDLFIICKKVPNADRRLSLYQLFDALYEIVSDPETHMHMRLHERNGKASR